MEGVALFRMCTFLFFNIGKYEKLYSFFVLFVDILQASI